MENNYVWGLDIGGTKTAVVVGTTEGEILFRKAVATKGWKWQELVDMLLDSVPDTYAHPASIGVSCGGPLNSVTGMILSPPNLPGWDEVPIVQYLESKLGIPAFVQNDADACALAEWKVGAGKGTRHMIFLTFGTGMGAGLILNGQLYSGACGMAGETGHVRLEKDGPWGFGKNGSFEGFCSGGGINKLCKMRTGKDLSCKELCELADGGNEEAKSVLLESARMLGRGLAMLMDLFNPECIVIGSIFARAERYFRAPALEVCKAEALPYTFDACRVVPALLGDRIGDVAAVSVAINGLERSGKHV
ncbi:MAG: ROK family protein [Clostridiales bacterium]|nr:ROK family protein [Clostridiales bacterium]